MRVIFPFLHLSFPIFFFGLVLLSACISGKKYERQITLAGYYQDKYNSLKHDSLLLAKRIDSLVKDSAEMHKKIEDLKKLKDNTVAGPVKSYKPQTMVKERELKLKVIYLYNIATGIQWQAKYTQGNFIIGVLGKSPLAAELVKELSNKKKGMQNFYIAEFESVKDIYDCQVLFISKGNYQHLSAVKAKVKNYPTLLVSEEDYIVSGTHFNLAVDGDELKMTANKDLLKKMNFSVSKSLLNTAN